MGRELQRPVCDGTTINRYTPVQVTGLTGILAIAASAWHSVALKSDCTVWAWGGNSNGQLGDGTMIDRYTPVQVTGLTGILAIAASAWHSVALKSDGTVLEHGDLTSTASWAMAPPPPASLRSVANLSNIIAITAGSANVGAEKRRHPLGVGS
ncbi:MAG: hypothetical protein U5O69_10310 [Candidatus Competibacteraceae bacterium]|nr:hypothetical protein [Candidatus Competibacteraceae bacterium]